MEKSICDVDDLIKGYDDLSSAVSIFRINFVDNMDKVGQKLDEDIKRVTEDIDTIKKRIDDHKAAVRLPLCSL